MKITFAAKSPVAPESVAVAIFEGRMLGSAARDIDKATGGALGRAMATSRFTGARGQFLDVNAPSGVKAARVVLVGHGKRDKIDDLAAQELGGQLVAASQPRGRQEGCRHGRGQVGGVIGACRQPRVRGPVAWLSFR